MNLLLPETIPVYVPTEGARLLIDDHSGIVGRRVVPADPESPILVYYEGNRYGYANVVTFADRVLIAASRMQEDYPTVAKQLVRPGEVEAVALYYPRFKRVEVRDARGLVALTRWLGFNVDDPGHPDRLAEELRCT